MVQSHKRDRRSVIREGNMGSDVKNAWGLEVLFITTAGAERFQMKLSAKKEGNKDVVTVPWITL